MIACFAVHVVALLFPVMSFGLISPNSTLSFSVLIACSSCSCGVFVLYVFDMDRTRHTVPFPGPLSLFSQLLVVIPVISSGTIVPVLSLSFRIRLDASGLSFLTGVKLCPLSRIIFLSPRQMYLPQQLMLRFPAFPAVTFTVLPPGSRIRSSSPPAVCFP